MRLNDLSHGIRALSVSALAAPLLVYAPPSMAGTSYLQRADVRSFMESMHSEHAFELAELERILGEAQHVPAVARLFGVERPKPERPVVRSYPAYRARFLTPPRIAAGVEYWNVHEADLARAEAQFGVPAEVILGIIGVETAYGKNTGSFRVVDALATIAFDGTRRQDYFRGELKELLLLARDRSLDPLQLKGSYAGAFGIPQFMPSSYRRYAVDFDSDGVIDLSDSPADAIGSVASYLQAFGWTRGEPALAQLKLAPGSEADLVSGLQRIHDVPDLKHRGVKFLKAEIPDGKCSVVELPTPGKPSRYVAGFGNFEAITRYNRSTFYATAVLDLAAALQKARHNQMSASAANEPPIA